MRRMSDAECRESVIRAIERLDFSRDFVIDEIKGRTYTYDEFFGQSRSLADGIRLTAGADGIVAIMENSACLMMLYFAAIFAKKQIAVIDPQKGADEIRAILRGMPDWPVLADAAVRERGIDDRIAPIREDGFREDSFQKDSFREDALQEDDLREDGFQEDGFREDALREGDLREDSFPEAAVGMGEMGTGEKGALLECLGTAKWDAPYLVTFTSGTTGEAKGVSHSLGNLCRAALALNGKVGARGGTFLHVMPMTYMAGILNSIFCPFLAGSRIVMAGRFSVPAARFFWKTAAKHSVSWLWLSPSMMTMIERLDRSGEGKEYCEKSRLTVLVGTAPLSGELRERFASRYGLEVYASYGLSETLFVSVETKESRARLGRDSVGELLDGVVCKLGSQDEILISVPWMFLGYTNVGTAGYFDGEYYKSGDQARMEGACLRITGRIKDLIIKGGMNISPITIEDCLRPIPEIGEVSVLGVKDASGEERILCAYVRGTDVAGESDLDAMIRERTLALLGKNYAIDYVWEMDELPRNTNGKVDKGRIRQAWMGRRGKA